MTERQPGSATPLRETPHDHRDPAGAKIGMWLFLYSELILFGGMFIVYAMYLSRYRTAFVEQSGHLSLLSGAANTVILLTSSLTVALSIAFLRRDSKRGSLLMLGISLFLGTVFLVIKFFEWHHKFELGIRPDSPVLAQLGQGATLFYALYFLMTGLHALHVLAGMSLLAICLLLTGRGVIRPDRFTLLENSGLYWHLVDLIWIYLFPLFYLIH